MRHDDQQSRWLTFLAVASSVVLVGLALGVSLPLVSLRLEAQGYGSFAIGVMAAMPAVGTLLGARLSGYLSARLGGPRSVQLSLLVSAVAVGLLSWLPHYSVWLVLRLALGICLTVTFVLGESWINQLAEEHYRGRWVALYGTGFALSQLAGPLLLALLGTQTDIGFHLSAALLLVGVLFLLGRGGAPVVEANAAIGRGLLGFARQLPALAWAVVLFACFESMVLTLLPVYALQQGFTEAVALTIVSVVVIGDACLQLPIGWLADRVSRTRLYQISGGVLLLTCLSLPWVLHSWLLWPWLVLFGASAGGLYTLSLILIGERYRDAALVRANAHIAMLWGVGALIGPTSTGAASQWLSGHALPWLLAAGAAFFLYLLWRYPLFATRDAA
ncbi:MFS transporter [Atopomonas sediminilitoris]|uniref:MFS transporter n=1 Tax=Atopomonas sediminilitoris TaxID=2919919 RepID=UPI001F4E2527|nr:MFS transporter [Atopomonas sediminilitoris]MCJ8169529.1 MFS transporter [Atopomonas sediminilitoris]